MWILRLYWVALELQSAQALEPGFMKMLPTASPNAFVFQKTYTPDVERVLKYDSVFAEWTRLYDIVNEQVY